MYREIIKLNVGKTSVKKTHTKESYMDKDGDEALYIQNILFRELYNDFDLRYHIEHMTVSFAYQVCFSQIKSDITISKRIKPIFYIALKENYSSGGYKIPELKFYAVWDKKNKMIVALNVDQSQKNDIVSLEDNSREEVVLGLLKAIGLMQKRNHEQIKLLVDASQQKCNFIDSLISRVKRDYETNNSTYNHSTRHIFHKK